MHYTILQNITQFVKERDLPVGSIVSGGETQDCIDETMAGIKKKHSKLFSGLGKVVNVDLVHIEVIQIFHQYNRKGG